MWRTEQIAVNKSVKNEEIFVLGGERKNSFTDLFSVINISKTIHPKNTLLNINRKVFHIYPDLIVLTSI